MLLMTVRKLTPGDLPAIDRLNPPDWPPFRRTFEHYFSTACAQPYGLEAGGVVEAMGTLIDFGTSGWISQLITHPQAQGRGFGSQMLRFLIGEADGRGWKTLSLVATEAGYPLYVREGFRVEGWHDFWTRPTPAPEVGDRSPLVRPLVDEDLLAVQTLDRETSGENRGAYWKSLAAGGWAFGKDALEGFFLPRVGEGLVVARTEAAGQALLGVRLNGAVRCVVPSENGAPARTLRARGFEVTHRARRMVRGAPLERHPEFLWSRIGGNLG
jgi:GNAT superfamily N-acetyltransferase